MTWFILSALLGIGGVAFAVRFMFTARMVWGLGAIVLMGLGALAGFFLAPEAWIIVGAWATKNQDPLIIGFSVIALVACAMAVWTALKARYPHG